PRNDRHTYQHTVMAGIQSWPAQACHRARPGGPAMTAWVAMVGQIASCYYMVAWRPGASRAGMSMRNMRWICRPAQRDSAAGFHSRRHRHLIWLAAGAMSGMGARGLYQC